MEGKVPFVIRGEVDADSREEALDRVFRMLKTLGFNRMEDGNLRLDRPSHQVNDVGIALGRDVYSITIVEIGEPG